MGSYGAYLGTQLDQERAENAKLKEELKQAKQLRADDLALLARVHRLLTHALGVGIEVPPEECARRLAFEREERLLQQSLDEKTLLNLRRTVDTARAALSKCSCMCKWVQEARTTLTGGPWPEDHRG